MNFAARPAFRTAGLWLLLATTAWAQAGYGPEPLDRFPKSSVEIISGEARHRFEVWVADTAARQVQGLMYVQRLDPDRGILFIYGEKDYYEGKAQNFLRSEDIEKILNAYSEFKNIDKYSYVATLDEIEENDFNLNIPRYVDITEPEEEIDVAHELKILRELGQERKVIEERMSQDMRELGFE